MFRTLHIFLVTLACSCHLPQSIVAWTSPVPASNGLDRISTTTTNNNRIDNRRIFCQLAFATGLFHGAFCTLLPTAPANAQPAEFQNLGTQTPNVRPEDPPFTTLSNGVKIADFKVGQGEAISDSSNARVSIQCNGRLLNLNGVSFYNTKNNNPDGFGAIPLTFPLNQGVALPGLEAGLVGMQKGGIRRIVIPAELAYFKYPNLEPQPTSELDRRALDSVIKNPRRDATILFDVKLERFK